MHTETLTRPDLTVTPVLDEFSELRGGRDEDRDPRAIRQIINEIDDLALEAQANPVVDFHSPVIRECKAKGSHVVGTSRQHIVAVCGIVVQGDTERAAFDWWITAARAFLDLDS